MRYSRTGNREDRDEFERELDRVDRLRRRQVLDRYLRDMMARYGYLIRNRYYQYVPVRNERLAELLARAQAVQAQLQSENAALRQQASDDASEDERREAEIEQQLADLRAAQEAQRAADRDGAMWADYMPYLMIAAVALLLLLLVVLIIALTRAPAGYQGSYVVAEPAEPRSRVVVQ